MIQHETLLSRIKSSGCQEEVIEAISNCIDHQDYHKLICILKKIANHLRQQIDKDFERIDCIDCFIYKIEKYDKKAS